MKSKCCFNLHRLCTRRKNPPFELLLKAVIETPKTIQTVFLDCLQEGEAPIVGGTVYFGHGTQRIKDGYNSKISSLKSSFYSIGRRFESCQEKTAINSHTYQWKHLYTTQMTIKIRYP